MKGKLLVLAGAAAGYVVGTRAGRQRYEQIKGKADALWHDPKVQQRISEAEETVRTKAPHVQERIGEATSRASDKVKSTVQGDDFQPEVSGDGRPHRHTARGQASS